MSGDGAGEAQKNAFVVKVCTRFIAVGMAVSGAIDKTKKEASATHRPCARRAKSSHPPRPCGNE